MLCTGLSMEIWLFCTHQWRWFSTIAIMACWTFFWSWLSSAGISFSNFLERVSMIMLLSAISSPLSSMKGRRPFLDRNLHLWSTFWKCYHWMFPNIFIKKKIILIRSEGREVLCYRLEELVGWFVVTSDQADHRQWAASRKMKSVDPWYGHMAILIVSAHSGDCHWI